MYAVVEIAGKQFKVGENDRIVVPSLGQKSGEKVTFDRVFLLEDGKEISIGNPMVAGASVEATVLKNIRDKKVIVFKKKKRKGYKVRRGHRQEYTQVQITGIAR